MIDKENGQPQDLVRLRQRLDEYRRDSQPGKALPGWALALPHQECYRMWSLPHAKCYRQHELYNGDLSHPRMCPWAPR